MLLGRRGATSSGNKQARLRFRMDSVERGVAGFANRGTDDEKEKHVRGNVEILVTSHGLVEAK